jgi:lipopolysaccharide/colanic/teichoic acid biosynthesis glycosyltransferase
VIFAAPGAGSEPVGTEVAPLHAVSEVVAGIQGGTVAVEAIVLRESNRELNPDIAEELVGLNFQGVPTYTLELFHQLYWRKIPLYRLNPTWLFQEGFRVAREPVFERLKRASDIMFAAVGLILASPVIAAASIAIKLEDRGPVFFVQTRVGRNRVPFRVVKLRTMTPNDVQGNPYTQVGDSRVTRIGRFLRSSRLDELPQLWNVLRGEMSLIGPRAEWDRLVEDYQQRIPCYNFRHLVKPGITGWAQVNYLYGSNLEDTVRKLEYDLYYIRYFSFTLDASIVLKTVQVMLFGKGR